MIAKLAARLHQAQVGAAAGGYTHGTQRKNLTGGGTGEGNRQSHMLPKEAFLKPGTESIGHQCKWDVRKVFYICPISSAFFNVSTC